MPSRRIDIEKPKICKTCINKDSSIDIYPCSICKTRILDVGSEDCYEKENKNMEKDNVNPDHYKNSTSLECIEAMELIFGWKAVFNFCVCNAWKYIWRWKNKNGIEDLNKAKWYIAKANKLCFDYNCSEDILIIADRMAEYINDILDTNKED